MELKELAYDELSYRIGEVMILDRVTLSLPAGQIIGVIGPNGAGKSTLLRLTAGVIRPTTGAVRLNGEAVHHMPDRRRARTVALMPQNPGIGFGFRVDEVVAMGRYPYVRRLTPLSDACRRAVRQAMRVTDIEHLADRSTLALSGGERQRVFLARALAQEPSLLLLDEPTANLDVRYQLQILEIVRRLRATRSITVIMAIHDLTWAVQYCDHLLMVHEGRIVASGPPLEVCAAPLLEEVFGVRTRLQQDPEGRWRVEIVALR